MIAALQNKRETSGDAANKHLKTIFTFPFVNRVLFNYTFERVQFDDAGERKCRK